MRYQPKYLAYCEAHGKTPAQMQRIDRKRYPGGEMTGFILWCNVPIAPHLTEYQPLPVIDGDCGCHRDDHPAKTLPQFTRKRVAF